MTENYIAVEQVINWKQTGINASFHKQVFPITDNIIVMYILIYY